MLQPRVTWSLKGEKPADLPLQLPTKLPTKF
jgi:hypothetical protein